jgi:hypothetical protein
MIVLVRRIVVISVVVLALLTWGVVAALAAPGGKSRPISKARAEAFAHAVNLRAGDLPASMWTTSGKEESVMGEAPPTLCLVSSLSPPETTGKGVISVVSPSMVLQPAPHGQHETVWSRVFVMPSVGAARADLTGARKCVARQLRRRVISPLAATLPRTQVAERRFLLDLADIEGVSVASYFDRLLFQVGRAEIELGVNAVAPPIPATTEQELLSLLYSRAEAHKL